VDILPADTTPEADTRFTESFTMDELLILDKASADTIARFADCDRLLWDFRTYHRIEYNCSVATIPAGADSLTYVLAVSYSDRDRQRTTVRVSLDAVLRDGYDRLPPGWWQH
jgi:hypothetical protein